MRTAADPEGRTVLGTLKGRGYRWHEFDERFDAGKHPDEPHQHQ